MLFQFLFGCLLYIVKSMGFLHSYCRHNSLNIFLFQWHHEIVVLCSEGGFVFADAGGGYV
jgi:hypothetical protein